MSLSEVEERLQSEGFKLIVIFSENTERVTGNYIEYIRSFENGISLSVCLRGDGTVNFVLLSRTRPDSLRVDAILGTRDVGELIQMSNVLAT